MLGGKEICLSGIRGVMFLLINCAGLSTRGVMNPDGFKMSVLPFFPHLALTVWGQALKVLVKTYIGSGRNNSLNFWALPLSFFLVRALENLMKVDLILQILTCISPIIFGCFWTFQIPSRDQFQGMSPCSVIIIDNLAHLAY